jgi:hypothetical protein
MLALDKVVAGAKIRGVAGPSIVEVVAYSAMDYYFDHQKKTVASAPPGEAEFREKCDLEPP